MCVGHNEMDNDAGIFAHVLAAVDGTCTGTFKESRGRPGPGGHSSRTKVTSRFT
jgi:hypothetical protein